MIFKAKCLDKITIGMRVARKKRFREWAFKHFQLEELGEVRVIMQGRQIKYLVSRRMRCPGIQEKNALRHHNTIYIDFPGPFFLDRHIYVRFKLLWS